MDRHRFLGYAPSGFQIYLFCVGCLALLVFSQKIWEGLPYISYVDEGHTLHRVMHMLREGTIDPGWYRYPSFLMNCIALAVLVIDPFFIALENYSIVAAIPAASTYYDSIGPVELVIAGRVMCLFFAAGIVVLSGVIGKQVAGAFAGIFAATATLLNPFFHSITPYVMVDIPATFFVLAAISLFLALFDAPEKKTLFFLFGLSAALAFCSKYPSGAIGVLLIVYFVWQRHVTVSALTCSCFGGFLGILLGAPVFIPKIVAVYQDLVAQASFYARPSSKSYVDFLLSDHIGLPVLVASVLAALLCLWQAKTRKFSVAVLVYLSILLPALFSKPYQPARNIIVLIPLAAIFLGSSLGILRMRYVQTGRYIAPVLALLFLLPWALAVKERSLQDWDRSRRLVDSRVQLITQLERTLNDSQTAAVLDDVTILPSELRHPGIVQVGLATLNKTLCSFSFIALPTVYPDSNLSKLKRFITVAENRGLTEVAQFGRRPLPEYKGYWRTNHLAIRLFSVSQAICETGTASE